jgi:hypothetical protein
MYSLHQQKDTVRWSMLSLPLFLWFESHIIFTKKDDSVHACREHIRPSGTTQVCVDGGPETSITTSLVLLHLLRQILLVQSPCCLFVFDTERQHGVWTMCICRRRWSRTKLVVIEVSGPPSTHTWVVPEGLICSLHACTLSSFFVNIICDSNHKKSGRDNIDQRTVSFCWWREYIFLSFRFLAIKLETKY